MFQHDENRTLTVEELIAYQFQNAREQARNAAGEDVKDVVITVNIERSYASFGTCTLIWIPGRALYDPVRTTSNFGCS